MRTPTLTDEERNIRMVVSRKVRRAIRTGMLVRQPCEVCGREPVHAHHRNGYQEALDVVWLCPSHHAEEHGRMYRHAPYRITVTYSDHTSPKHLRVHLERITELLASKGKQ